MQDIHVILESLHAMEADLVPANDNVVSLQARNDIPTYAAPFVIDWNEDYNQYKNPKNETLTVTKWRPLKEWERAPIFLMHYDTLHGQEKTKATTAIKASDEAMQGIEALLKTQVENTAIFDATKKEILEMCANTKKINRDAADALKIFVETTKIYTSLFETFQKVKPKLIEDIGASRISIQAYQKMITIEKHLCYMVSDLDLSRYKIFEIILEDKLDKYTKELKEQAKKQLPSATKTKDASYTILQTATAKNKPAADLLKTNSTSKSHCSKGCAEVDAAMAEVELLRLALMSPKDAPNAQPQADEAPNAQVLLVLQQQQQAQQIAQHAAEELSNESAEALQAKEHALVQQQVELSQEKLAEAVQTDAANSIVSEQIVQIDKVNVDIAQQHVAEAQERVADVKQQLRETQEALSHEESPVETGILNGILSSFVKVLSFKTDELHIAEQKEAVAESVLHKDVALQAEQSVEAYHKASAVAVECEKAAIHAKSLAKADIQNLCDALVQLEQSKAEVTQRKELLLTTEANLIAAKKTMFTHKIKAAEKLKSDLDANISQKQQEVELNIKKTVDLDQIMQLSNSTYKRVRQSFADAQVARHTASTHAHVQEQHTTESSAAQMPDLLQDWYQECLLRARETHNKTQTQAAASHADVELAKNTLADNLEKLEDLIQANDLGASDSNEIIVETDIIQETYNTAAKKVQEMITTKDEKLSLWNQAAKEYIRLKVLVEFHDSCANTAKKILDSTDRQDAVALLTEQVRDNENESATQSINVDANYNALQKATEEFESAMLNANEAIKKLESVAKLLRVPHNPTNYPIPPYIQEIDIEQMLRVEGAMAKTNLAPQQKLFDELIMNIKKKLNVIVPDAVPDAVLDAAAEKLQAVDSLLQQHKIKLREWHEAVERYCKSNVYLDCLKDMDNQLEKKLQIYITEIRKYRKTQERYAVRASVITILTQSIEANKVEISTVQASMQKQGNEMSVTHKALQKAITTANEAIETLIQTETQPQIVETWKAKLVDTNVNLQVEIDRQMENAKNAIKSPSDQLNDAEAKIQAADAKIEAVDKEASEEMAERQKHIDEQDRLQQVRYDKLNETMRSIIDTYVKSNHDCIAQCERNAQQYVLIETQKELLILNNQILKVLISTYPELASHEIGILKDKIAVHESTIYSNEAKMRQFEKETGALLKKRKEEKTEVDKQNKFIENAKFTGLNLKKQTVWTAEEILPLFSYNAKYNACIATIIKQKKREYDAGLTETRQKMEEIVNKYIASKVKLNLSLSAVIKLELQIEKHNTSQETSDKAILVSLQGPLQTAQAEEAADAKTFDELRAEAEQVTRQILQTVKSQNNREIWLKNLVVFRNTTSAVVRQNIEDTERAAAGQPAPAHSASPDDAAPALSADARAKALEKNTQQALSLHSALFVEKTRLDSVIDKMLAAYLVTTIKSLENNNIARKAARAKFEQIRGEVHRIILSYNADVTMYTQKVQLIVDNTVNAETRAAWAKLLKPGERPAYEDMSGIMNRLGIKEATIAEMSGDAALLEKDRTKLNDVEKTADEAFAALVQKLNIVRPKYTEAIKQRDALLLDGNVTFQEDAAFREQLVKLRRLIRELNELADVSREACSNALTMAQTPDNISHWSARCLYDIPDYNSLLKQKNIDSLHPAKSNNEGNRKRHEKQHDDTSYTKPSSLPLCSFKQSLLAFAAQLLALVYPPVPAKIWLARPPVARYAHPDRARAAGGSLELHALCARVAHIALLVHIDPKLELLAAHRFLVELPEHARLLALACSPAPSSALYAARAAPSREHANAAAIRACLSRSSLQPLRACAAATVAAPMPTNGGTSTPPMNQSSQQYV